MAETYTPSIYTTGGENKRTVDFTLELREWVQRFKNTGILFYDTINDLRTITAHNTDMVAGVYENVGIYCYDETSLVTDDGEFYIKPNNIDSVNAGRWVLKAKLSGQDVWFYTDETAFPSTGNANYLYIDKSNGKIFRWLESTQTYVGVQVSYSLDSGKLEGQLPTYYKTVTQVTQLPTIGLETTIYELLEVDGDKEAYSLWQYYNSAWHRVAGQEHEQSDLSETDSESLAFVKNKTTTYITEGTNLYFTNQRAIDAVSPIIPTSTSDLFNDSNFVSDADYVHTDNNFTDAEQSKLNGIEAGAEVNVNADWDAISGDAQILNKPNIPVIDPNTVIDADYVHTDNNYTDADAQVVANTSGINTGDEVHVGTDEPTGSEELWVDTDEEGFEVYTKTEIDLIIENLDTSIDRRHDFQTNTSYCGTAQSGTLESATTWTLTKIVVAENGTTTTTHATDSWTNHLTANYI